MRERTARACDGTFPAKIEHVDEDLPQQPAHALHRFERRNWNWNTFWTALGSIGAIVAALIGYQSWWSPRHETEVRVSLIGVERLKDKDDAEYIVFTIHGIINNSGTVGISLLSAVPYAVPLVTGLPELELTRSGVSALIGQSTYVEPGKQESFNLTAYMERSFLEAGRKQQLATSGQQDPAWHPAAGTWLEVRFEAESVDGKYLGGTSPPQLFAFENSLPVVAHPKSTAILLGPIDEPKHRNMFR